MGLEVVVRRAGDGPAQRGGRSSLWHFPQAPRIERGDIVELQDGTRVYVTEYSRDLGHGAPAVLNIDGFRV